MIAVAQKVADDQHLSIGSPVTVHSLTADSAMTPTRVPDTTVGSATRSSDRVLTVRAIYDSALLVGSPGFLVSQPVYEQLFPASQNTDLQVYEKLKPGVDPALARAHLQPVVAAFPPAELQDLTEFKKTQTKPIDRFVTFVWAMLLMAVLISAIGILNTLMLSVYERTRELGLLRAAGMARAQVRTAVRWEAVIISILGTLIGLIVGVFFAWALVRALSTEGLRVFAVPPLQLAVIVVLAGVIGVLAAVLPARRAANLDVLQAIATE
jgi:putative ABC transport system permease protein